MGMPKGKTFDDGYCSVSKITGSKNYRQISDECGKLGMKIGPSNVRNVLLSAMRKIAKPISEEYGVETKEANITKIAKNPEFQLSVATLIKECE